MCPMNPFELALVPSLLSPAVVYPLELALPLPP